MALHYAVVCEDLAPMVAVALPAIPKYHHRNGVSRGGWLEDSSMGLWSERTMLSCQEEGWVVRLDEQAMAKIPPALDGLSCVAAYCF